MAAFWDCILVEVTQVTGVVPYTLLFASYGTQRNGGCILPTGVKDKIANLTLLTIRRKSVMRNSLVHL